MSCDSFRWTVANNHKLFSTYNLAQPRQWHVRMTFLYACSWQQYGNVYWLAYSIPYKINNYWYNSFDLTLTLVNESND